MAEESNIKVSSEISEITNGKIAKDDEKFVDESSSLPVVGHSNETLNDQFDSDSTMEASMPNAGKDSQASDQVDTATIVAEVVTEDSISPSKLNSEYEVNKRLIDTTAPFESVKEAVSKFGGIVDWKAHKVQTVERRKIIEQELDKVQQEIPLYKEQSEIAEKSKTELLKELESTKRLIEDLKLNLERAQTEERQAKQDSELAQLRVEEMGQGITHEVSVAAKTQLEVAKSRHENAVEDLKTVKDELEALRKNYAVLLTEKNDAEKKAEAAVSISRQVEKTVEELTVELIYTKELLESAHSSHLQAEELRIGAVKAMEEDRLSWDKDLKQVEDDMDKLNIQIELAKDLKSKLNTATMLLADLKAELASYMESKISREKGDMAVDKELKDLKINIVKATDEVNCLKMAATSLNSELVKERLEIAELKERGRLASTAVSSLEVELERVKSELYVVQEKEKEVKEKMTEFPNKIEHTTQEANEAKSVVELAQEELRKTKEVAEEVKAEAFTMENRLISAQKEIDSARASERLALAAIKALQESESSEKDKNDENTSIGVTLSLEEYYGLSKRAHEAEEAANMKVTNAMSQIELAKESEIGYLAKLEESNREMEERKESLRLAMDKAEKAKEGKLGVEQELRKWRADHEQKRKEESDTSSIYGQEIKIEKVLGSSSPPIPYGSGLGLKNLEQIAFPRGFGKKGSSSTTPESEAAVSEFSEESSVNSPKAKFGQSNTVKKKRRTLFPKFFMFLGRRKSSSKTS